MVNNWTAEHSGAAPAWRPFAVGQVGNVGNVGNPGSPAWPPGITGLTVSYASPWAGTFFWSGPIHVPPFYPAFPYSPAFGYPPLIFHP